MSKTIKDFTVTFTIFSQHMDVHAACGIARLSDSDYEDKHRLFKFKVFHPHGQTLRQIFIYPYVSQDSLNRPIISLTPVGEIKHHEGGSKWNVKVEHAFKGKMGTHLANILIQTLSLFFDGLKGTRLFDAGYAEISATRNLQITSEGQYGAEELFEQMLES
jgi:hypothetical protein